MVERISDAGATSFLAVLKRFGPGTGAPLSFPMAGWTLTMDLPGHRAGLADLLDGIDRVVVDAGGRLYLAKDSRMDPALLADMYPDLPAWKAVRGRADPDGVLQSDLGRRLGLCRPRRREGR